MSIRKFERANETGGIPIASEIPSLALHDGVIVHRDLSLATGWTLQLPNTMLAGDGLRADLTVTFRSLLNSLPANYDWQFRFVQHGRIAELSNVLDRRPKPDGLAGEIVREMEQVNLSLLSTNQIAWKEAQLFIIRRPLPAELLEDAGARQTRFRRFVSALKLFLNAIKPGSAIAEAQANADVFESMLTDIRSMVVTLEPALKGAGLFPARISDAAAMRILYEWANKERYEIGGTPANYSTMRSVPLCELFALTEYDQGSISEPMPPGVFRMGGKYQSMLTLDLPPDELGLGVWERVIYESGITRMDVTAWGSPNDKTVRIRNLKRTAKGLATQGDAPEKRRQREEIDRELEELGGNTDRLWRMFVSFRVWGDTPAEVVQTANQLIIACEGNGRIALVHERKNMWGFLRATCPGWTQDRDPYRVLDVTTRQVARLLPMNGQPTCLRLSPDAVGAIFPTISSTSGLLNIDPHDRSLYNAPHFLIAAGTGQGKSVLASSLILDLLGEDGRAVMIDRGGSFDGLAAAMGVTSIKLTTANKDITLNPLYVTPGRVPDPDEIGGILMLLECMIMASAQKEGRLAGEEARTLREVLMRLFESRPGEERVLGQLRDELAKTQSGRWLAANLSVWCAGAEYGTMFDGPNNVPMGGRLTVIDLGQDVRGANQALTNVLTMLIISIVSQLMAYGSVRRKYVIFDEAGIICKNKAQFEFLEYAYRTFRKTGTGVGALTQKAMDLAGLFSYAPLKFFLRQDDMDDTREAASKAGFSEETVGFIRDLETQPGEYADFVVVQQTQVGTQSHLCRNYVTPLKYAMITSDKEDTYAISEIRKEQRCNLEQAMRVFAERFPRGVAFARNNPQLGKAPRKAA